MLTIQPQHTRHGPSHPYSQLPVTTPCTLYTWRFVSCPAERWRLVSHSLNTGVNTGLLSTSNALRITEGRRRGRRRSFEALLPSFSLASFYPTYFPSFLRPCPPFFQPFYFLLVFVFTASPKKHLSSPLSIPPLTYVPTTMQISFWWWVIIGCLYMCVQVQPAAVRWALSMTAYGMCEWHEDYSVMCLAVWVPVIDWQGRPLLRVSCPAGREGFAFQILSNNNKG